MSKPEFLHVTELYDHDVVLGRGSGPNDRQGNINFRLLCQEKKIAYIEATSRDEKGRIAAGVVATVHDRGGRFLKRLTAEQAKDAGVKMLGADAVYELADKQTILEKTKQTLRQNRADFVAKVEKEVGRAPVVGAYPIHQRKNGEKQKEDEVKSNSTGGVTPEDTVNSLDPIPLGESCGLDSLNRPSMGKNSAKMLLNALFSSSDLQSNDTPQHALFESTQSVISAMSIHEMSAILRAALDKQSSGTEMDSAIMCQSILNECNVNEHMADQLVKELVKENKSQRGSSSFTGQQKALLLEYEQMQDHQRVQRHQQVQEGRQQPSQHPLGQYRLEDNDNLAPSSVFSSLLRHYNDGSELNHLPALNQDCAGSDGDPTVQRPPVHRTTLAGGEQIEPANYMDESMDISYRAAKDLHSALGGSLTSVFKPANSREPSSSTSGRSQKFGNSMDSSFNDSLMSMSISELDRLPGHSLPSPSREGSSGAPDEVKVKSSAMLNSLRVSDLIVDTEEDFRF
ncbi:hypothetical protein ACHAWT_010326 [Skeletonema menzelii]